MKDIFNILSNGLRAAAIIYLPVILCACNQKRSLVTITTLEVSGITQNRAESGGWIKAGNRAEIDSKGICWAISPDPSANGDKTEEGKGKENFRSIMTDLQPGTEYYVRAYAITGTDTVYGRNFAFTTEVYPTISDVEGNVYNVITIGKQIWMGENLRTRTYNDGTPVPVVSDEPTWAGLSTPACCWYRNEEDSFKQIYGTLYNWYTVNTGRLCPAGWHIPSDKEWDELAAYAGGESIAGGKLKETGTTYWVEPNYGATNEYGFSAFPGGFRYYDGKYFDFGFSGYWWSSSSLSQTRAYFRFLYYNESILYRFDNSKKNGFSVRCLKD